MKTPKVQGFKFSAWKVSLLCVLSLLSGGTIWLLLLWMPRLRRALCFQSCDVKDATHLQFQDGLQDDGLAVVRKTELVQQEPIRFAVSHYVRYHWNKAQQTFAHKPLVTDANPHIKQASAVVAEAAALRCKSPSCISCLYSSSQSRAMATAVHGPNKLDVAVPHLLRLLAVQLLHPFCLFQYASVVIWCWEYYYTYSAIIFGITVLSVAATAWQEHKNLEKLAEMAKFRCPVSILTSGVPQLVDSSELLPGDIVLVSTGPVPADVVLLQGEAVVDEALLTGEATSVRKVAWSAEHDAGSSYSQQTHGHCTLIAGTMIQATSHASCLHPDPLGLVVSTGFDTTKGGMLKGMLAAPKHPLSFTRDGLIFIAVMLVAGLGFYAWSIVVMHHLGSSTGIIVLKYLDMITVAVPPALAATLAVATAAAVSRLAKSGIFVSSSQHINFAGLVDFVAFDKTGTLTQSGLEFVGVAEAAGGTFTSAGLQADVNALTEPHVQVIMATCHGLSQVSRSSSAAQGEGPGSSSSKGQQEYQTVGDSLDLQLFQASGWTSVPTAVSTGISIGNVMAALSAASWAAAPPTAAGGGAAVSSSANAYKVLRRFDFSAARLRSTVLVQHPTGALAAYVKGSPEVLAQLCDKTSLPNDFDAQLHSYTAQGYRVLALAYRLLPADIPQSAARTFKQTELEAGLKFCGLVALRNPLKPCSTDVVQQLHAAAIPVVMVTGDHIVTAVVLAQQCSILAADQAAVCITKDSRSTPGAISTATKLGATSLYMSYTEPLAKTEGKPAAGVSDVEEVVLTDSTDGAMTMTVTAGTFGLFSTKPCIELPCVKAPPPDPFKALAEGSKQCCITGDAFQQLYGAAVAEGPDSQAAAALEVVLRSGRVYARMRPGDKQLLMVLLGPGEETEENGVTRDNEAKGQTQHKLRGLGRATLFCGDGANDLGALKSALVGVSLCQAEASIAAPLTSKEDTPAAVLTTIAEGRCSLSTAFMLFRFIMCYACIQVLGINLMYIFGLVVGNYQYLIQDLIFCTTLAAFMSLTKPCKVLSVQQPAARVMTTEQMVPVALQLLVIGTFQIGAVLMLRAEPWYMPPVFGEGGAFVESLAPANAVVFCVNVAQIWICAVIFNIGRPFRQPMYTNYGLVAVLLICLGLALYFIFSPVEYSSGFIDPFIQDFAGLVHLPAYFRWKLFALIVGNLGAAALAHYVSLALVAVVRKCWPALSWAEGGQHGRGSTYHKSSTQMISNDK